MAGYQGWASWATWNVALWINNEERLYKAVLHAGRNRPFTAATAKAFTLQLLPQGTPDFKGRGGVSAYKKVDWNEIADDFNETSAHVRSRSMANRSRTR